jgi:ribonuclease P protein component
MQRLRKRQDFLHLRDGRRANAATLTLQARPRADATGEPRAGFTVTRRTGGAVERNRIRRRLREALRRVAALHARDGHDYVVVGRSAALRAPFETIVNELKTAFGRVHADRFGGASKADRSAGEARR